MTSSLLSDTHLHLLRDVLHREAGICIKDDDVNRVLSRLLRMLKSEGLSSMDELLNALRDSNRVLTQRTLEAVTINETSFFRDDKAVTLLCNEIIPHLQSKNQKSKIKIWSAGCSTGQEAYSIAIAMLENCSNVISNISIIATDVSPSVIAKAQSRLFSEFELKRGISDQLRNRYFNETPSGWQIKQDVSQLIEFRVSNMNESIHAIPLHFDVVFLRNVMIYFNETTRAQLIKNIKRRINPGGYMFLGTSECVLPQDGGFKKVKHDECQFYQ